MDPASEQIMAPGGVRTTGPAGCGIIKGGRIKCCGGIPAVKKRSPSKKARADFTEQRKIIIDAAYQEA